MNRRDLIKSLPVLLAIPFVGASPTRADETYAEGISSALMWFGPSTWRKDKAAEILRESGEMWLAVRERHNGRNPVLIAFEDHLAVEIVRDGNLWTLTERPLSDEETASRDQYRRDSRLAFTEYPLHKTALLPRIGQRVFGETYTVRAWIHNGRYPGWVMSVDGASRKGAC